MKPKSGALEHRPERTGCACGYRTVLLLKCDRPNLKRQSEQIGLIEPCHREMSLMFFGVRGKTRSANDTSWNWANDDETQVALLQKPTQLLVPGEQTGELFLVECCSKEM